MSSKPLVENGAKGDVQSLTQWSNAVNIINGADLVLGWFGIVPAGTIPAIANGIIAIGAGITGFIGRRKAEKKVVSVAPQPKYVEGNAKR